jgi:large subunit ribosomal protein L30|tara:strand:- start:295 stop:480 length:186 start_codon:yes stop_codon:yes gene_type:complete
MTKKKIKIILRKSTIGSQKDQIATVKGLGLRKLNSFVIRDLTPETMGMVKKVSHLITTEEQ